jgi:uncharacterized repeat protein (TIGR03803 family)
MEKAELLCYDFSGLSRTKAYDRSSPVTYTPRIWENSFYSALEELSYVTLPNLRSLFSGCPRFPGARIPFCFAQQEKVIYAFGTAGFQDGQFPDAALVRDSAGNLYGTTSSGGSHYGTGGTVFRLSKRANGQFAETILHNFDELGGDGWRPATAVTLDSAGNIYGTTAYGGAYTWGAAYELSPNPGGGYRYKLLHSFGSGTDGVIPYYGDALVFDASGNLFGATNTGGLYGQGTVFELSQSANGAWSERIIHNFGNGTDFLQPSGLTFDSSGNLYGAGAFGGGSGNGGIYELVKTTTGWSEKILYNFVNNGVDGYYPNYGLVFDSSGNLYGTTAYGGSGNPSNCEPQQNLGCGIVFELTPTLSGPWTETILHNFTGQPDANYPQSGPVFDAFGNLYGTSLEGGGANEGTVYKLSPQSGGTWTESIVYNFGSDGTYPYDTLLFDPSGNIYGTAEDGGAFVSGVAFEIIP